MAENENKNEIKSQLSNNKVENVRPNLTSFSQQTFKTHTKEEDATYSGMSLNELLNRKKRVIDDDEDMSFASTMVNKIKKEHEKRTKKIKIIMLSVVAGIIVILLLLIIIFPELKEIIKLN